jgi:hypothetical protein
VAGQEPAVGPEQLQAEPVPAVPRVALRPGGGHPHLGQRPGGQHPVVAAGEERREPGQVLRGRPELAGRRHLPGVLGRLGLHDIGPRVDGKPPGVRRLRLNGGAGHAQRFQDLPPQDVGPVRAA